MRKADINYVRVDRGRPMDCLLGSPRTTACELENSRSAWRQSASGWLSAGSDPLLRGAGAVAFARRAAQRCGGQVQSAGVTTMW